MLWLARKTGNGSRLVKERKHGLPPVSVSPGRTARTYGTTIFLSRSVTGFGAL
jgi:hypothetical protein